MEDLAGRRKTLERERSRLEKLLGQHPQWRMMRAAGHMPERVEGVWEFPGLNRVQASALRESLVFRAYRDVLDQLEKMDERRDAVRGRGARDEDAPSGAEGTRTDAARGQEAGQDLEDGPERHGRDAGQGHSTVGDLQPAFRTKVKLKPIAKPQSPGGENFPMPFLASPVDVEMVDGEPVRDVAMETEPRDDEADVGAAPAPTSVRHAVVAEAYPEEVGPDRGETRDDLTRIRSISRRLAAALSEAGVVSFRQIAAWNGEEVLRITRELDLGHRIWREGWIEQAAALILKSGGAVPEIMGRASRRTVSEPVERREDHDRPADAQPKSAPLPRSAATDENRAKPASPAGVVPATLALPITQLVDRSPSKPALTAIETPVDDGARGAQDASRSLSEEAPGEIESSGGDRVAVAAHAMTEPQSEAASAPVETAAADPVRRPVRWGASHKVGRRPQRLPAPSVRRLTYVRGLTDDMAERLRASGVRSLKDIAEWRAADVEWFQAILGDRARITEDQWIEQAAVIAEGRWTAHALALVRGRVPDVVAWPEPGEVRQQAVPSVAAVSVDDAEPDSRERVDARPISEADPESVSRDAASSDETVAAQPPEPEMPAEAGDKTLPAAVIPPIRETEVKPAAPSRAAVLVAPIVVPFVPVNRSQPPAAMETRDGPGQAREPGGSSGEDVASASPEAGGDAAGDGAAKAEVADTKPAIPIEASGPATAPPEPLGSTDTARPAASLFADDLVEKLMLTAAVESDRRIFDAKPTVETRDVETVEPVRDLQRDPQPAADPVVSSDPVAPVSRETVGSDDGFEPGDGWEARNREAEDDVSIVAAQDDFADAEALVIKQSPTGGPRDVTESETSADDALAMAQARVSAQELFEAAGLAGGEVRDAPSDDGGEDDGFAPLGEEASVRIVSRRRDRGEVQGTAGSADRARDDGTHAGAGSADDGAGGSNGRERLGFSPEFLARRMEQGEDESDEDYAGYRDEVEEATVTIIRAKGRSAPESSIVPERIANDQSGVIEVTPDDDAAATGDGTAKKRGLGSRFLKALTGD